MAARNIVQYVLLMVASILCLSYPTNCFSITLRAFIGVDSPLSFHPDDCADGIISDHLNQIYDTLFWIDYDGNLVPSLATEWKRVDPYVVQIKLRKGVSFHNGEIFDSHSVKYTFDRFVDPLNKVANRFYGSSIARVEIVDKYTVNIITQVPDSLLVYRLAVVGLMIPPKYHEKVGKRYFSQHPVGTGPFKFVESIPNSKLVLESNLNYWAGCPEIDRLEFHYYSSVDKAVVALKEGEIDFVAHIPGRYSEDIQMDNHLSLLKKLTRQSIMLLVNTKKNGPLQDKEFRQRLRAGINFNDVIKYGHNGNGVIARSLTFRGEPFDDDSLKQFHYDVNFAKQYIRQHNIAKKSFKILITKPYDLGGRIIAKQMHSLGLNLDVEFGSDKDEIKAVLEKNQNGLIPEIDFLFTYCAHRYALGAFPLLVLLHSKGNWSMTADPTLDNLLDSAMNEFDFQKQREKFWQVNRYVYDNALVFPGFQHQDLYGYVREIGFVPHVTAYVYFKDVKIIDTYKLKD